LILHPKSESNIDASVMDRIHRKRTRVVFM